MMTLQPAWRSYFVFYAAILIFGIGPSINPEVGINKVLGWAVSFLLIFFVIFRRKTTFYRLTKDEIQRETAFAGRVSKKSLPLQQIAGLEVRRGIIHRLLGVGHLHFRSKTPTLPDLWWFGIADPFMIKRKIDLGLR
jgi:uncharacterized membrane protein YdbT with pleckstrin-like domain